MALSHNDVKKVANLAYLELPEDKLPNFTEKFTDLLALVQQLEAVDTDNVEPLAHPLELTQRLRPDEVNESDIHKAAQANAPAVEDNLYLVPQVIDES